MNKRLCRSFSLIVMCLTLLILLTGCRMSLGDAYMLGSVIGGCIVMTVFFIVAVIFGFFAPGSSVPWVIYFAGVVIQAISLIGTYGKYRKYALFGLEKRVAPLLLASIIIAIVFFIILCAARSLGSKRIVRQIEKMAAQERAEMEAQAEEAKGENAPDAGTESVSRDLPDSSAGSGVPDDENGGDDRD